MGFTVSSKISTETARSRMDLPANKEVKMYFKIGDLPVSSINQGNN